ncbi:MAG: hypothetical protein QXD89_02665 [Candidatus Aenigmatarchaeota archaeon]
MKYRIAKFLFLPIILLFLFSSFSIYNYINKGEFFIRDLDLKGGTLISFITDKEVSIDYISLTLGEFREKVLISISKTENKYSIRITFPSEISYEKIIEKLKNSEIKVEDLEIQFVGPELGSAFFSQVIYLLSMAYILIFLGNFFIYKKISIATTIIFSSLANIICIFGITTLFGIPVSFAGFTSILLVIAYTIDDNVLLSTRILSGKPEEFYEQYKKSLITGGTITSGLIISMIIVLIFSNSPLLNNIAEILLIGYASNMINTYILNAGIIEVSLFEKRS